MHTPRRMELRSSKTGTLPSGLFLETLFNFRHCDTMLSSIKFVLEIHATELYMYLPPRFLQN